MQQRAKITDAVEILMVRNAAIRGLAFSHYSADEIERWCVSRTVESFVADIQEKVVVVEERNGKLVAAAQLNPRTAFVEGLYVLPTYAHQGIGLGLLRFLESTAAELGLERLSLEASLNAVLFYQRAGYVNMIAGTGSQAPAGGTVQMQRRIEKVGSNSPSTGPLTCQPNTTA